MNADYRFRAFTPPDIAAFAEMQDRYREVHPNRPATHPQILLSPYCAHGEYVCCAFDAVGRMAGCCWFYPQSEIAWVEILIRPELPDSRPLQDRLFEQLLAFARKSGIRLLDFQLYPDEPAALEYARSRGAAFKFNVYTLQRSLALPIPVAPAPAGFEIQGLRLQNPEEQRAYLEARRVCFPHENYTLEQLRFLTDSPLWTEGVCMCALKDGEIAASVSVFWEPGSANGFTENVFTLPGFRGRGLARALLAASLDHLRAHGLQNALLEVQAENESALSLYRGLNYTLVKESRVSEMKVE